MGVDAARAPSAPIAFRSTSASDYVEAQYFHQVMHTPDDRRLAGCAFDCWGCRYDRLVRDTGDEDDATPAHEWVRLSLDEQARSVARCQLDSTDVADAYLTADLLARIVLSGRLG